MTKLTVMSKSSRCTIALVTILMSFVMVKAHGAMAGQAEHAWTAPDIASRVENPIKANSEGLKAAAALYKHNCVICHGVKGDSNGPAANSLPRRPANFTDVKMMQKATDGELFWKMSTGLGHRCHPGRIGYRRRSGGNW